MNPEESKRAAEQWLDEALDLCQAAAPRTGLETRILAHLEARARQRKRRWTFVLTTSAGALLVVIAARTIESRPDAAPPANATPEITKIQETTPGGTAPGPHKASMRVATRNSRSWNGPARPAAEVKQESFPSAIPVSEERERLQTYLQQTPKQELHVIAQRQRSAPVPDLTIEPIEIKELTPIQDLAPKGNL